MSQIKDPMIDGLLQIVAYIGRTPPGFQAIVSKG
jgi:hypothetical protein